ncbi:hypothetical protein K458DRAFT_422233 [Lentithecium fluviatile CBS 122367]|uniref:Uncharacterized protein n=1 Tax=Lentithecium fluviatile CBS 122367 TaxID=1168545 RepID=A0A6G1IME7_9PLEO|nr:hypothetical protein K458DRAFT_422233 [Lentithecium fluviatile CBS 122367]
MASVQEDWGRQRRCCDPSPLSQCFTRQDTRDDQQRCSEAAFRTSYLGRDPPESCARACPALPKPRSTIHKACFNPSSTTIPKLRDNIFRGKPQGERRASTECPRAVASTPLSSVAHRGTEDLEMKSHLHATGAKQ